MFKIALTVVLLSVSCINASENVIENPTNYSIIQTKSIQNLAQVDKQQPELVETQKETKKQKGWLQSCWDLTNSITKCTATTLLAAYVITPIAVDGLWSLALSEGTASKYARSVLRFFKPVLNYSTTNFINHFFKLI